MDHAAPVTESRRGGAVGETGAPWRVYSDLRERIINFDLPPGTTLGRNALARSYGVSQTPVRDALQRLAQDGLVLIWPQSRTVVARIDVRQLSETQFLRVAVETEVVRRLAEAPSTDLIERIRAVILMQQALVGDTARMDLFSELDRRFHRTLFAGVGMEPLHAMVKDRLGHLYRCQRLELPHDGKMEAILEAHRAIADGIAAADPARASAAMRAHLSGTITRIESLRCDHPDYFTTDELNEAPVQGAQRRQDHDRHAGRTGS